MKVLLVQDYAAMSGGGEVEAEVLRAGLRVRGIDARILASRARVGGEKMDASYLCFGTTGRFRTLVQTANPSAALALRRALLTFRPDVVHLRIFLTQLSPLVLPLLREVPCVYHAAWYRAICPRGTKLLPNGRRCGERWGRPCRAHGCLAAAEWVPLMVQLGLFERWRDVLDLVIANSRAVRDRLEAEGIAPVEVIWNGTPERPPRPALGPPPVVAFAGRLVWEKGVDVLIHAFALVRERVPGAVLLVAGEGPERSRLEALATKLGVASATRFLGYLARADLERALDCAWVQVLPGRWEEPFGMAAVEAMMRGTAVVASAAGGPSEIVGHGDTGILVPSEETEELAAAIQDLVAKRDLAERMGARGRAVALERFAASRFVDDWVAVYRRLLAGRTSGAVSKGLPFRVAGGP